MERRSVTEDRSTSSSSTRPVGCQLEDYDDGKTILRLRIF
jgi:hypothetical protein